MPGIYMISRGARRADYGAALLHVALLWASDNASAGVRRQGEAGKTLVGEPCDLHCTTHVTRRCCFGQSYGAR